MTRLVLIPEATTETKNNEILRNRKRRHEDDRDCMRGIMCNTEVLAKACGRQEELKTLTRNKFFIASMLFLLKIIARSKTMLTQFRNTLLNMMLVRQRTHR